jgi:hypothetical protein
MSQSKRFLCLSLFLTILFSCQSAWAEKTDIVYLKNGDRVTGEVKTVNRGKLQLSTDHMGTIYIEWTDILQITSSTGQALELTDGRRYFGNLTKPEADSMVTVATALGPVNLNVEDIFAMYPVESNFWDRLDINVDFGLSWDKGSEVGKYSLGLDAKYRRTESISMASFSTEITTQKSQENTQRTVLSGMHNIFRPGKKFHSYFGNLESNDQLGINLRALIGAGYGWVPIRSQRNWFSAAVGLAANRETPSEGEAETNLEAVGWLTYEYYKFDSPERAFTTNLKVFPSLTDWGRWRANLNTDFTVELFDDLYWKMDFYLTYDNEPVSSDASTSDYGVTTSIGYKF